MKQGKQALITHHETVYGQKDLPIDNRLWKQFGVGMKKSFGHIPAKKFCASPDVAYQFLVRLDQASLRDLSVGAYILMAGMHSARPGDALKQSGNPHSLALLRIQNLEAPVWKLVPSMRPDGWDSLITFCRNTAWAVLNFLYPKSANQKVRRREVVTVNTKDPGFQTMVLLHWLAEIFTMRRDLGEKYNQRSPLLGISSSSTARAKFMTTDQVLSRVRKIARDLPAVPNNITLHCFRVGAASALRSLGNKDPAFSEHAISSVWLSHAPGLSRSLLATYQMFDIFDKIELSRRFLNHVVRTLIPRTRHLYTLVYFW